MQRHGCGGLGKEALTWKTDQEVGGGSIFIDTVFVDNSQACISES